MRAELRLCGCVHGGIVIDYGVGALFDFEFIIDLYLFGLTFWRWLDPCDLFAFWFLFSIYAPIFCWVSYVPCGVIIPLMFTLVILKSEKAWVWLRFDFRLTVSAFKNKLLFVRSDFMETFFVDLFNISPGWGLRCFELRWKANYFPHYLRMFERLFYSEFARIWFHSLFCLLICCLLSLFHHSFCGIIFSPSHDSSTEYRISHCNVVRLTLYTTNLFTKSGFLAAGFVFFSVLRAPFPRIYLRSSETWSLQI